VVSNQPVKAFDPTELYASLLQFLLNPTSLLCSSLFKLCVK
jgi:hypothetical protein